MVEQQSSKVLWSALTAHHREIKDIPIKQLFEDSPHRADLYQLTQGQIYVDYSKHKLTDTTLQLLIKWARSMSLEHQISDFLSGEIVNHSEHLSALHTALRAGTKAPLSVRSEIETEYHRFVEFARQFLAHQVGGLDKTPFRSIVNLGIGGSEIGSKLVCDALCSYQVLEGDIRFVASFDLAALNQVLVDQIPQETLFILSSKSFKTEETLSNARRAKDWLIAHGCDPRQHFVAVTANLSAAREFGVLPERCFRIWDWVGGRYSLWSAIGLPIMLKIGIESFQDLLSGAEQMDKHFATADFSRNIPIILALIDIWYNNFFSIDSRAVFPYTEKLRHLPEYLAQLFMESNGKSVCRNGRTLSINTSPIIWGGIGTAAQHTYFQFLHQGSRWVPVEFIAPLCPEPDGKQVHAKLFANCLAQSKALMDGEVDSSNHHASIRGDKPSTSIFYEHCSPQMIGSLLAMYEHRTIVQGFLWGINPFDQWGVEFGKRLSKMLYQYLEKPPKEDDKTLDASTRSLLMLYRQRNYQ